MSFFGTEIAVLAVLSECDALWHAFCTKLSFKNMDTHDGKISNNKTLQWQFYYFRELISLSPM